MPRVLQPGTKRKRSADDADTLTAAASTTTTTSSNKRARHTRQHDLLSPLSDELLVRILSLLSLPDLLSIAPVSRRFHALAADSQLWRRLYYARFVLPRALRIPGFRDGSAREGKLHYASRRTVWADGRRGGWVDMDDSRGDWKRQYKLRHNWSLGKCAVEELNIRQEVRAAGAGGGGARQDGKTLVKVVEGVAVTADLTTGLRAWDLKTKRLVAQTGLLDAGSVAAPSCMTIDDQKLHDRLLDVAIGFTDGSFGVWRIGLDQHDIERRYRHEKSSNGALVGLAYSSPYLLTATKSVLVSLYTFNVPEARPSKGGHSSARRKGIMESDSETERESAGASLPAPYLLTSLKSHTSRDPLALSIRKSAGGMTVASIAYTFSTIQGWSLGIQDLHIRPPLPAYSISGKVVTTRLAYTLPVRTAPRGRRRAGSSLAARRAARDSPGTSFARDADMNEYDEGPTSICYTHPYLLATLPDNTLILHLCTSTSTSLSISPGIRLWGHTSGISDAEITARGKAVSVSHRGDEIRVWELEGRGNHSSRRVLDASNGSIAVRPTPRAVEDGAELEKSGDVATAAAAAAAGHEQWDDKRNWVGFDDEMVIVLKESRDGRESLLVYDFT
ncbi:uncharacterized protein B0I36DRAFT_253437 [Microdochium trichocladiopsis]|uniref:F-box domain-containing protein n=1 Tax=Microdochium trichocladiopsis TaxID=1682393 RepID=A0A9P8XU83_9PEZI|nr:uncharacterized protein B0I36DRAFT_253437 [Microdochium trichocladiopsis]KAH7018217.1 hypothetical protein B0I36DRAFT_253437 [Microdochium trichocladiopsis]